MEKNGKNGTFFYKERKRTQRTECSFIKNAKECKERNVVLKRTDAQPCKQAICLFLGYENVLICSIDS